jgi:hypothetical protein
MMMVLDNARFQRYRRAREQTDRLLLHDLWLPALLFGGVGAITWAIRGTDGWGGIDGTLAPGLAWGLIWHYLCARRGIDARGVVLWLGLGIALGGELGYGQYVSWIRGQFETEGGILPVARGTGLAWFILCGIGWGAPGGILLGWALDARRTVRVWTLRAALVVVLLAFIFNLPFAPGGAGMVSWLGEQVARHCPWLLFPLSGSVDYAGTADRDLVRTIYTNTQNFAVVAWWLAALAVAALERSRATLVSGAVIGGGFGIGFMVSALWCLGYAHAPHWIDWWKMWELHAGFNLGLLYAVVLYWASRRLEKTGAPSAPPRILPADSTATGFMAAAGFVLVFAAGVEYFFWTGLALALFYPASLIVAVRFAPGHAVETRKHISLVYAAFLLVFMLCHGGVSRLGVFLELYAPEAVDQYAWPPARIALLVPPAAVLVIATLIAMAKPLRAGVLSAAPSPRLPARMIDLFAFIGLVGAVSIWPSKIGVLYAFLLCLTLFACTRINRRFDELDRAGGA